MSKGGLEFCNELRERRGFGESTGLVSTRGKFGCISIGGESKFNSSFDSLMGESRFFAI